MPLAPQPQAADRLPTLRVRAGECSVSGLSSGAFMTVQLHLAHSSLFAGAGIVAGGPYACAASFPGAAPLAADAYVQNAVFICMNPLTPQVGPQAAPLAANARRAAAAGKIEPLAPLERQRVYVFTGSRDTVVHPTVVQATRDFYAALGVHGDRLRFVGDVPAGHALLTTNPQDNPLGLNAPPYINQWPGTRMQSQDILEHIHGGLAAPAGRLGGQLLRFDQRPYFDGESRASMSSHGWLYVPQAVLEGKPCRIHVSLHGCKQGASYVNIVNGRPASDSEPPYGLRWVTGTGYNEMAESNDFAVLYPQAEGIDDGITQNPEGCWDWWGYSSPNPAAPDYCSRDAIQIRAIRRMLADLGAA